MECGNLGFYATFKRELSVKMIKFKAVSMKWNEVFKRC